MKGNFVTRRPPFYFLSIVTSQLSSITGPYSKSFSILAPFDIHAPPRAHSISPSSG